MCGGLEVAVLVLNGNKCCTARTKLSGGYVGGRQAMGVGSPGTRPLMYCGHGTVRTIFAGLPLSRSHVVHTEMKPRLVDGHPMSML